MCVWEGVRLKLKKNDCEDQRVNKTEQGISLFITVHLNILHVPQYQAGQGLPTFTRVKFLYLKLSPHDAVRLNRLCLETPLDFSVSGLSLCHCPGSSTQVSLLHILQMPDTWGD